MKGLERYAGTRPGRKISIAINARKNLAVARGAEKMSKAERFILPNIAKEGDKCLANDGGILIFEGG